MERERVLAAVAHSDDMEFGAASAVAQGVGNSVSGSGSRALLFAVDTATGVGE